MHDLTGAGKVPPLQACIWLRLGGLEEGMGPVNRRVDTEAAGAYELEDIRHSFLKL